MLTVFSDEHYMKEAYKEACKAFEEEEIPIGAIVVCNNRIIARGYNQTERLNDVTAHAEMIAITSAANHLGSKYLTECDLYVTIEPCVMCAGALYWAQFRKVVFGAPDPKRGYSRISADMLHPKTELLTGVLQKECEDLMKKFFLKLRDQ
ncbi:MAG: nucleoside deaminase [Cytophagaceae bacterium]